ncbi:MAG TPA: hypothetical protein ENI69_09800 [Rhodospirillales bacterium]|nr:hypothetical protein [Rhodospirillales bacterium]
MRHPITPFAVALISILALSSCAEMVKTFDQMQQDDQQSRAAQLMRIADSTAQGGDLNSALALYRRASAFAPEELPPLIAIGDTAFRLSLFDQAAKAYEQATRIEPNSATAHSGSGKTLIALAQPKAALFHYQATSRLAADQYGGYNGQGVALDLLGRHGEAQVRYRDGLKKSPDSLVLANNLALSLAIEGDFDAALEILTPYRNNPRAGVRLRQNLALIYGLTGQKNRAAALAALDLKENAVLNNLKYYEKLRTLAPAERAKALLGAVTP